MPCQVLTLAVEWKYIINWQTYSFKHQNGPVYHTLEYFDTSSTQINQVNFINTKYEPNWGAKKTPIILQDHLYGISHWNQFFYLFVPKTSYTHQLSIESLQIC